MWKVIGLGSMLCFCVGKLGFDTKLIMMKSVMLQRRHPQKQMLPLLLNIGVWFCLQHARAPALNHGSQWGTYVRRETAKFG